MHSYILILGVFSHQRCNFWNKEHQVLFTGMVTSYLTQKTDFQGLLFITENPRWSNLRHEKYLCRFENRTKKKWR